ncbi:hydroxyisourate hydrolase [Mycolicibacterium lacusdiani]|uniref:hydroxyisourate hydrolase n=1 Tax=Mycolicibacterium lacusdiani TaxID=2895283 RepID=UPI001F00C69D|nr:hydroxyisourate hydrolase [Mycolicibacterium lacusdiani]
MTISTHVLDAVTGTPAAGVAVTLLDAGYAVRSEGLTDDDGRISRVAEALPTGVYRLRFDTGAYFARLGTPAFYPEVTVTFEIVDATAHHHVPLLLSPYAYSTYRGS